MRLQWGINVTNYTSVVGGKKVVNQCLEFVAGYMMRHYQVSADAVSHSNLIGAINGADPQCES